MAVGCACESCEVRDWSDVTVCVVGDEFDFELGSVWCPCVSIGKVSVLICKHPLEC